MKDSTQNSFKDDDLENEDIDLVFSQLTELDPPEDIVQRVMQAVTQLPPLQMLQFVDE